MRVPYKSDADLALMRESGRIASEILEDLCGMAMGMHEWPTLYLDRQARHLVKRYPDTDLAFLNYRGFPAALCVSVNEEAVHGIPGDRKLKNGDVVKLDFGVSYRGWHSDCARTVIVGGDEKGSEQARDLIRATSAALDAAITRLRTPLTRNGQLGEIIGHMTRGLGFFPIADHGGHGIGLRLHEDPFIPNDSGFAGDLANFILRPGHVIAIEPIATTVPGPLHKLADGWTMATEPGALSAHFEDTIAITKEGPEILTRHFQGCVID